MYGDHDFPVRVKLNLWCQAVVSFWPSAGELSLKISINSTWSLFPSTNIDPSMGK